MIPMVSWIFISIPAEVLTTDKEQKRVGGKKAFGEGRIRRMWPTTQVSCSDDM